MKISDIHTHDPHRAGAIINWKPGIDINPAFYYSCGVHPWDAANPDKIDLMPESSRIVAIGEVGLDKLRGPSLDIQTKELRKWIDISERRHLPVILHIVKAFPEIIAQKKELSPTQPWIIHGFRGKPQLAAELIRHGFYISVGKKYNPESIAIIPRDRLFAESDEEDEIPDIPGIDSDLPDKIFLSKSGSY